MSPILSPSIVCCGGTLAEIAATVNRLGCDRIHIDAAIGYNIHGLLRLELFGPEERSLFSASVDLHVFDFRTSWTHEKLPLRPGDCIIAHLFPWTEPTTVQRFLEAAVPPGISKGLSLDTYAELNPLIAAIPSIEAAMVMGIEIGGRGLPLNERAIDSLSYLRSRGTNRLIIDGGVNVSTLPKLARVADTIVIGGLLFSAPDLEAQWRYLQHWLEELKEY